MTANKGNMKEKLYRMKKISLLDGSYISSSWAVSLVSFLSKKLASKNLKV
jgi:hypothetical protein